MESVKTLIDKWSETRSQKLLANILRVSTQRISEWKYGKRPMPASTFAKLAEMVAGEAAAKELTWAYVHRNVGLLERLTEGFRSLLAHAKGHRSKLETMPG